MESIQDKLKTKKLLFLYFIQILILLLLSLFMTIQYINIPRLKIPLTEWNSKYTTYHMGWHIDENVADIEDTVDMIYGPYVELKKGTYSITVDYSCDEDQECLAYANSGNDIYIKTDMEVLPKDRNCISYDFTLMKDINNFEVVIKYDGNGALEIRDIDIKKNMNGFLKAFIGIFLLILLGDVCILLLISNKKSIIFIILGIFMFLLVEELLSSVGETSWGEWEDIRNYPYSYDVVFLGPSTAQTNISHQELYEKYGIAGISLAESVLPTYVSRYVLEEMLQYQSPQVVFFDTSSLFYSREDNVKWAKERKSFLMYDFLGEIRTMSIRKKAFKAMQNYNTSLDITDCMEKVGNIHYNWKNVVNPDFSRIAVSGKVHHGNIEYLGVLAGRENTYDISNPEEVVIVDEKEERYLSEMIDICNREGVELIMLTEKIRFTKAEHNAVENLAEKYNVRYIDINEHIEELGFDFGKDLNDAIHFNLSGAIKCSHFLGDYLLCNYEITDKRLNLNYTRYEDERGVFSKRKESISKLPFREYLRELIKLDKKEYAIFISVFDEATFRLEDTDRELLRELGIVTDFNGQYGSSFAAVIYDSDVQEQFAANDTVIMEGEIDNLIYKVISEGFLSGDDAAIELNGTDYIRKGKGFNIVVYNRETQKVEDTLFYNTRDYKNPFPQ